MKYIGLWVWLSLALVGCGPSAQSVDGGLGDVRQPIHIDLAAHEAMGGHTIARHVAKTDAYLIARLRKSTRLNTVSSFSDLAVAQASINAVLNIEREAVAHWWRGDLARQAFFARVPTHGYYMTRAMLEQSGERTISLPVPDQAVVRVVLARQGEDYYVLTAFPQQDEH
ncbi:MAG: RNase A-like domain-containing protein [Thiomicrospira sp.]